MKKFLIIIFIFSILILPSFSLAQGKPPVSPNGGLVPCTNTPTTNPDGTITTSTSQCDWNALMTLVNNIINFILYGMAIPVAAIMFAYAGFLLVTAGGEAASARTKAKSIFTNAVIGLILAVACWLIVKLILSILGWNGAWIGF
jgi:hypothetical protein